MPPDPATPREPLGAPIQLPRVLLPNDERAGKHSAPTQAHGPGLNLLQESPTLHEATPQEQVLGPL